MSRPITYRALKRQFALDDEALDDLKFELIEGEEVAADKEGKVLIWVKSYKRGKSFTGFWESAV